MFSTFHRWFVWLVSACCARSAIINVGKTNGTEELVKNFCDKKQKARHNRAVTELPLIDLLRELCNLTPESRNLSACIVLVNDLALRGPHELRFSARHRLQRRVTIAALDRLLDGSHRTAHRRAARLVDDGAAGNLARRLFGGSGIGHVLNYPSTVTDRGRA